MAVEVAEDGCVVNYEAEYMAVVEAVKEILWMKDFIGELGIRQDEYRLYCDSQSAIHLAKNAAWPTTPGRSISSGGIIGSGSE